MSPDRFPSRPAPPLAPAGIGIPLLRLGFRPFYLGAAAGAVIPMLLWQRAFVGSLDLRTGLAPAAWHGHEMLFGVVPAVVAGFLFTAGKTWTGLPTPRGAPLGALVMLWASARLASVVAPYPVYLFLDVTFLPLVTALFFTLLVRSRNRRNLPIVVVLLLLSISNLSFHLAASGSAQFPVARALHAGLGLMVILVSIIAGRVVPAFTVSVTPGLELRANPARDGVALAATATGFGLWVVGLWPTVSAVMLAIAAGLHSVRLLSWSPWVSRQRPILWVLHVSYAWIPVGLVLLAAAQLKVLPESAGLHALTVGAIGGMLIGMMTRTARGHTARSLQASKIEVAAYTMVSLAAMARIAATGLPSRGYQAALILAGTLWIFAFALYLTRFTPWLLTSRTDGHDG